MTSIKLQNGKYISANVIEITAFPQYEIINETEELALQTNKNTFERLLFEFHKISDSNFTCLELLWITEKVENQAFKARPRLFVVLRKIGNEPSQNEASLEIVNSTIIDILTKSKFNVSNIDLSDKEFIDLVGNVKCDSSIALAKSERLVNGTVSQATFYTWDVLNIESDDTMSDFVSALSQSENSAVSMQIIPTTLNSNETTMLNSMLGQYAQAISMGDGLLATSSASISYAVDNSQKALFYYNICVYSNPTTSKVLATKLISLLQSGNQRVSESNVIALDLSKEQISLKNNFYQYPWYLNERLINQYRNPQLMAIPEVKMLSRLPYLMTIDELNVFLRMPLYDKTMSSLKARRDDGEIEFFNSSIVGEDVIKMGKLISGDSGVEIGIPLKSWTQHALVVGMPGTGKTTFSFNILTQFHKKGIPFLVVEPTKAEYRAMIDAIDGIQIFTPGNNEVSPFIINPFIPPKGITVEQYTPSLMSAFKAAFSMDGPLEMIFQKAVNACYIENGWKQNSKLGDEGTHIFGMFEYILCFKRIMKTMNYKGDTQSNIETAGLLRLMNIIEQNRNIYDTVNTIPIEDLLTKSTVIELNSIENDEQKALIMALLLSSICVYTKNNQIGDGNLKNVILIDEAHVLLDTGKGGSSGGESQSTTVRTVQKMVAEIRSYGTSIIIADQKPSKVTEEIVSNTNVKVSFRLSSSLERNLIGESTDMSDTNKEYISNLGVGQAFVHFDKLNSPQLVQTEDTRQRDGIRLSVPNEEIATRMTYWNGKEEILIPFRECSCTNCKKCSFIVRNDAEFYASKLYNMNMAKIIDKKSLFNCLIRIPSALLKLKSKYSEEELERLYNCTIVQFLRKAELNTNIELNLNELKIVVKKATEYVKEKGKEE